jgi:hypothetical protein
MSLDRASFDAQIVAQRGKLLKIGSAKGNRTPIPALKGQYPDR